MNEIVMYKNELNQLRFNKFSKVDSRIFFALCAILKDKDDEVVTLSFDKLRNLSNYDRTASIGQFANALEGMYNNILASNVTLRYVDNDDGSLEIVEAFNLFNAYKINPNDKTAQIQASKFFREMLKGWEDGGWTRFELETYTNLKSEYSQTMFRLLKQWRMVGGHEWEITNWRNMLGVPSSYQISNIEQKILQPIRNELSPIFKNLKIIKLKQGRGNKITHIKFTFTPETIPKKHQQPDTKTKAEKVSDLETKESVGKATPEMSVLKEQIKTEKEWMEERGFPDTPKKRFRLFGRKDSGD